MTPVLAKELASVALFLSAVTAVFWAAAGILLKRPRFSNWPRAARRSTLAAAGGGLLCMLHGLLVEPYRLTVRSLFLSSPKVAGEPLRLVHVSDAHVRRWGRLEEAVLSRVRELDPDIILLTGDYVASPGSPDGARRLLEGLARIAPAYAVRGNMDFGLNIPEGFQVEGLHWLLNKTARLRVHGTPLFIGGADPSEEDFLRRPSPESDPKDYSIALCHYPDLLPRLGQLPYDLLLCGHTHGGQVRLPFIGALISLSQAGTRFAQGLFESGGRAAYVTQGIGTESFGLPPIRFLCPPEVALIILSGN